MSFQSALQFVRYIILGTISIFFLACSRVAPPPVQAPHLHSSCLPLKPPVEDQMYGVSVVWDQKGERYALVTDVATLHEKTNKERTSGSITYHNETMGVVKVDKNVPLSDEVKISLLRLVKGRWEFRVL